MSHRTIAKLSAVTVVVVVLVVDLVAGDPVVEGALAGQPGFAQQLHGAIHRRVTDVGMGFPNDPEDLVAGDVLPRSEKCGQNRLSLLGVLETVLVEISIQRPELDFMGHADDSIERGALLQAASRSRRSRPDFLRNPLRPRGGES